MITKITSKEYDITILKNLNKDLLKKLQDFKNIANGFINGSLTLGNIEYKEYKKAKKRYDFNYSKVKNKYPHINFNIWEIMEDYKNYYME